MGVGRLSGGGGGDVGKLPGMWGGCIECVERLSGGVGSMSRRFGEAVWRVW